MDGVRVFLALVFMGTLAVIAAQDPGATVTCTNDGMEVVVTHSAADEGEVFIVDHSNVDCFSKSGDDHGSIIDYDDCGMTKNTVDPDETVYTLTARGMVEKPASLAEDRDFILTCSVKHTADVIVGSVTVTNAGDQDPFSVNADAQSDVAMTFRSGSDPGDPEVGDTTVGIATYVHVTVTQVNGYPECSELQSLKAYTCSDPDTCGEFVMYEIYDFCSGRKAAVVNTDEPIVQNCLNYVIPINAFTLEFQGSAVENIHFIAELRNCFVNPCPNKCEARRRREADEEDWKTERNRRQAVSGNDTVTASGNLLVTYRTATETVTSTKEVGVEECMTSSGVQLIVACMATMLFALLIALIVFAVVCCRRRNRRDEKGVEDNGKKSQDDWDEMKGGSPCGPSYLGPYQPSPRPEHHTPRPHHTPRSEHHTPRPQHTPRPEHNTPRPEHNPRY